MIQLFSRSIGQGPPLIILHGLFGSSDNWQTFAKMMSDHFQVITIDLRNHGLSPHTEDFDFDLLTADVLHFAEENKLDQFYLMGHSMGGKVAASFALQYPDIVSKLIILDIAMKSYPPHHQIYFDAMRSLDFEKIKTRTEADSWLQKGIDNITVRQFILKNLVRDEAGNFKWRFNLESLYQNYNLINQEIKSTRPFYNPTLIVSGEYSKYIHSEDLEEMKSLFPNLIGITISEAGHWIHADQPGRLKQVILDFI